MSEIKDCCGGAGAHEEWCPTHIRSALTWIEPSMDGIKLRERAEIALNALIERDGLVRTLTTTDVLPLSRYLYHSASVGCCLHLPLASDALDNKSLNDSVLAAKTKGHAHCETLARVLLRMTDGQRISLARQARK